MPARGWANAPLWTLRFEVLCYLALGFLGWLGLLSSRRPAVVTFAFFAFWLLQAIEAGESGLGTRMTGLSDDVIRFGAFFSAGAFFYSFRDRIPIDGRIFAACALVLPISLWKGGFQAAAVFAIPYAIHYLAVALPLSRFDARADYSYGLYVFAFPLQQTFALVGLADYGLPAFIVLSLLGGLACAVLSYRSIEEPFLRLKDLPRRLSAKPRREDARELEPAGVVLEVRDPPAQ